MHSVDANDDLEQPARVAGLRNDEADSSEAPQHDVDADLERSPRPANDESVFETEADRIKADQLDLPESPPTVRESSHGA